MRDQIKAYIQAQSLDPGWLTKTQLESVIVFAGALDPVKLRIQFIKKMQHSDDSKKVDDERRTLVKDPARKLQTAMEHESAKRRPGDYEVMESASK